MREIVGYSPVSSEPTLEPISSFDQRRQVVEQIRPSLMPSSTFYERSAVTPVIPTVQDQMQPNIEYKPAIRIKTEPTLPDPTKADYYLPEGSLSLRFHNKIPAPFMLNSEEWQKYISRRRAVDNRIRESMLGANIG